MSEEAHRGIGGVEGGTGRYRLFQWCRLCPRGEDGGVLRHGRACGRGTWDRWGCLWLRDQGIGVCGSGRWARWGSSLGRK